MCRLFLMRQQARARQMKGEMVVYGDAMNEPILHKAYIEFAEIVVVSIGDAITAHRGYRKSA